VQGELPRALLAGRVPLRVSSTSREAAGLLGAVLPSSPASAARQAMQLHPKVHTYNCEQRCLNTGVQCAPQTASIS